MRHCTSLTTFDGVHGAFQEVETAMQLLKAEYDLLYPADLHTTHHDYSKNREEKLQS